MPSSGKILAGLVLCLFLIGCAYPSFAGPNNSDPPNTNNSDQTSQSIPGENPQIEQSAADEGNPESDDIKIEIKEAPNDTPLEDIKLSGEKEFHGEVILENEEYLFKLDDGTKLVIVDEELMNLHGQKVTINGRTFVSDGRTFIESTEVTQPPK